MPYEIERSTEFDAWLQGLADPLARKAIFVRMLRIRGGLLGDRKSIGAGVSELRIDVGQGYRVYYMLIGRTTIRILWAGGKSSQKRDIKKAQAMAKEMHDARASRVRERPAGYAPAKPEDDEGEAFVFTEEQLKMSPFDVADYIVGDDSSQIFLLRDAFASCHAGYIAEAIGAVARARARGLSGLERETGIKRQTLNKSLSRKGNPTLETLMTVLGALGMKLDVIRDDGVREADPAA